MQRLLIDTNVLMLLIVGTWDRQAIRSHRRTAIFTPADFDILQNQLTRYAGVVITPGILTEVSNLMGNDFHARIAETIRVVCKPCMEIHRPKDEILKRSTFSRLGFGDSSILAMLADDTVVLTDDIQLYLQVLYEGHEALNFNRLRKIR
jgi:hypothetical protein